MMKSGDMKQSGKSLSPLIFHLASWLPERAVSPAALFSFSLHQRARFAVNKLGERTETILSHEEF